LIFYRGSERAPWTTAGRLQAHKTIRILPVNPMNKHCLSCSVEMGVNFVSSQHNHENRGNEGSPPQRPSRGTAGQFHGFQNAHVIDPPRGRPDGGGAFIANN
jgi:hypothetical protein